VAGPRVGGWWPGCLPGQPLPGGWACRVGDRPVSRTERVTGGLPTANLVSQQSATFRQNEIGPPAAIGPGHNPRRGEPQSITLSR
jgi:hypothetical protein